MARASAGVTSNGVFARIDDHEIIAEAMHLVEVPPHRARDLGSGRAQVHLARTKANMPRAANDVMQSIIFSAVLDGIAALKRASGGLPNQLLRDVQAIHPNVTFADLPKELQDAIAESTRAAFTQLLKEGYAVGPRQQMQQSRPMDRVPERQRRGRPARPAARPAGADRRRPTGGDGPRKGPAAGRRGRASRRASPSSSAVESSRRKRLSAAPS